MKRLFSVIPMMSLYSLFSESSPLTTPRSFLIWESSHSMTLEIFQMQFLMLEIFSEFCFYSISISISSFLVLLSFVWSSYSRYLFCELWPPSARLRSISLYISKIWVSKISISELSSLTKLNRAKFFSSPWTIVFTKILRSLIPVAVIIRVKKSSQFIILATSCSGIVRFSLGLYYFYSLLSAPVTPPEELFAPPETLFVIDFTFLFSAIFSLRLLWIWSYI